MSTLLDLTRMDKIPVEFTLDGMRALRNAEQTDQVNLQELMRRQAHEQQMDPLRVQQAQLANLGAGQKLAEGEYGLSTLGRKDQMERDLFGTTQQAKLKELLAGASDNDAKRFENELYNRARNARPGTPQHTAAMKALEFTRGAIEETRKSNLARSATHANNATQIKLEQMRIDAGKYTKANRIGFEESIRKLKKASEIIAAYRREALLAQQGGDVETARRYLEISNDPRLMAQAEIELRQTPSGGKAGDVDLGAHGIPTTPQTTITPSPLPAPAAPAASAPTAPAKVERQMSKSGKPMVKGPDGKWYYE